MALSMSRRRTTAPSLTRDRSSGQKSTAVIVPASSEAVFFTEFTVICLRRPGERTIFTVCSRPWASTSARISAEEYPKPTISRSKRLLKLLPAASIYTASSRLVLPWAFRPRITFMPGEKSMVSKS